MQSRNQLLLLKQKFGNCSERPTSVVSSGTLREGSAMRRMLEVFSILWNRLLETSVDLRNRISAVWPALAVLFLVLALVLTPTILVCTGHLETGFGEKTLWD